MAVTLGYGVAVVVRVGCGGLVSVGEGIGGWVAIVPRMIVAGRSVLGVWMITEAGVSVCWLAAMPAGRVDGVWARMADGLGLGDVQAQIRKANRIYKPMCR